MNKIIKILFAIICCFVMIISFAGCNLSQSSPVEPVDLTSLIETSILQYPSTNASFRYNVYDNYVEITECLTAESEVEIPDKIENLPVIGVRENAFSENSSISSLIITDNLLFIRESAFASCENLKSVQMSKSLLELDTSAFIDCISLKEINLPATLKYVAADSFSGCTNLEKIIVDGTSDPAIEDEEAEGYRYIDAGAFSNCPYLKNVWMANDLSLIDETAFDESTEYLTIYGYATSSAAQFAAANLINFEVKDKNTFYNTITVSTQNKTPNYKSFGQPIASDSWKIEITNAKEYKSIGTYEAEKGKSYLVLTFKVTNETTLSQPFNYLYAKATVSGYSKYPVYLGTPRIEDTDFLYFDVEPGKSKSGYLIYEVNENWKYISLDFEDYAGFADKGNIDTCLMVKH